MNNYNRISEGYQNMHDEYDRYDKPYPNDEHPLISICRQEIEGKATYAFLKKYAELSDDYEELYFTDEEMTLIENYFEENGFIADMMDARKDISMEMIISEFDCYVKGHTKEKKTLANMIYKYHLVNQHNESCSSMYVFNKVLANKQTANFHPVVKHLICLTLFSY